MCPLVRNILTCTWRPNPSLYPQQCASEDHMYAADQTFGEGNRNQKRMSSIGAISRATSPLPQIWSQFGKLKPKLEPVRSRLKSGASWAKTGAS